MSPSRSTSWPGSSPPASSGAEPAEHGDPHRRRSARTARSRAWPGRRCRRAPTSSARSCRSWRSRWSSSLLLLASAVLLLRRRPALGRAVADLRLGVRARRRGVHAARHRRLQPGDATAGRPRRRSRPIALVLRVHLRRLLPVRASSRTGCRRSPRSSRCVDGPGAALGVPAPGAGAQEPAGQLGARPGRAGARPPGASWAWCSACAPSAGRTGRTEPANVPGMPAPLDPPRPSAAPRRCSCTTTSTAGCGRETVLELADEVGLPRPADERAAERWARWFRQAADSGSLVRYLETFAHTVGVMQRPEAVHRVARECALDLAADGVVYAEVRMAPELATAGGHADRGRRRGDARRLRRRQPGGRRGRDADPRRGAAVRHAAERPVGRGRRPRRPLPGRRRRRVRPGRTRRTASRPTASPRRSRCSTGPVRTARSTRARRPGIDSIRAALDGAHAERLGHGVRIADEVAADGALGPLARRVRDEQVPLEVAPSSNVQTGAYPSLAEHPVDRLHRLGLRRHRQHRQPADERGVARPASWPTWRHVRLDLGRRPDGDRAGAGGGVPARGRAGAAARRRRPPRVRRLRRLTRAGDTATPVRGMPGASPLLTWVHRQSPVILPDGPSGHERIRADPASTPGRARSPVRTPAPAAFLLHGTRPSCIGAPPRMTLVHPVSFERTPSTPRRHHSRDDPEPTGPTFAQLGLPQPLVTALERRGIHRPFAIQASALPDALAGRDVLGKAATGSGKTLAFGLPLLARLGAEVRRGPPRPARPGPRADPRAGPAGARQPGPARPGASACSWPPSTAAPRCTARSSSCAAASTSSSPRRAGCRT